MVKIALGRADPAPPDHTARMRAVPEAVSVRGVAVPDSREPVPGPRVPVSARTAAVRDPSTTVPTAADPAVPDRRDSDMPVRDRGPETSGLVPAAQPTRTVPGPAPVRGVAVPDSREPVPGPRVPVPARTATVRDPTTTVPTAADPAVPDRHVSDMPVRDRGPEISGLVPAARTAARTLAAHGTPLSRKELARQLRADGHQLSNATATALLRVLRAETTPPPPDPSHQKNT
ncbi:hypothetical protein [Micromonospora sp. MP36]|uniref:hypothetical protein n=1 Tax=Micromonospora sp. MP36 TaxID=2604468 RepID=UPI00351B3390